MNQYPQPNPYAPPQVQNLSNPLATGPMAARVEGNLLVVANGSMLAPLCLKCGERQGLTWRDQKFMFVPPWARLFGALIQVIVAKRSRFSLPLCPQCTREWRTWTLLAALSWLPGVGVVILGGVVAALGSGDVGVALVLGGFVIMIGVLIAALVLRTKRIVVAAKIDKTHTWLRGIHDRVLQAIAMGQV